MNKRIRPLQAFGAVLLVSCVAYGQAVPAGVTASGPSTPGLTLPTIDGTFQYSLNASETWQHFPTDPSANLGSQGNVYRTNLSGDAEYASRSVNHPFSLLFASGVQLSNQSGAGTTTFQNLAISQAYQTKFWVFSASDTFSFLPQTPTTGLSGVPGTGDLGSQPVQTGGEQPFQGVLTQGGNRVSNGLTGNIERQINGLTSVSGTGTYAFLRFLDDNAGLNTSQYGGSAALNRRINARTRVSANAAYTVFTYNGGLSFDTRGINFEIQRLVTRFINLDVSVGPQWLKSSDQALIPSTTSVAVSSSLVYSRRQTTASIGYSRGANGGSGVQPGGISNSAQALAQHNFGRDWSTSASLSYSHTTSLASTGSFLPGNVPAGYFLPGTLNSVYGGLQANRRISQRWSAYASYTAQHQSSSNSNGSISPYAFQGTSNIVGVGVSFTPRAARLGQF